MTYYVEWPCTYDDGKKGVILFPICKTLTDAAKFATRQLEVFGDKWAEDGKKPDPYITVFKNKRAGPELIGFYELVDGKLKKEGTFKLTDRMVV